MNGLCQDCEEPAENGRPYCEIHIKRKKKQNLKDLKRRRDEGLCIRCNQALLDFDTLMNYTTCSECRSLISEVDKRRFRCE